MHLNVFFPSIMIKIEKSSNSYKKTVMNRQPSGLYLLGIITNIMAL